MAHGIFRGGGVLATLLATLCPMACAPAGTPPPERAVVDDGGRAVLLDPVPARIVSLVPSMTELVVALGAADRLVARTDFDTDPALAPLPSLGRTLWPDAERLHALRPDLVLAPPDPLSGGLARRLEALGVRVYEVDAQRLDTALETMARVATLLGEAERGEALARRAERTLDSIGTALAGAPETSAVYLVWHTPPYVAGRETYVDDLLGTVRGRNVFADVSGWAEVSLEEIVRRDPRWVIVPRGDGHSLQPEWLSQTPGWKALPAVRAGRLLVVDSDLLNRPGPRVVDAARALARGLHPGTLAQELDP